MEFEDYFKYFDKSLRLAMIPRFKWSQRSAEKDLYPTFRRAFFLLESFSLGYQCIGVIIYWYLFGRKAPDTQSFVAEISEATSALMLVAVGFFNICVLSNRRPEIEILLTDLRELYPRPRDRNYRQQYYFGMANCLMKFEFIYFWMFTIYYNTAPLVAMAYENLMDGLEMRYKTQINTWYPWKVYGSSVGFGVGHFTTLISSIGGVAFSLGTHNIICIITYQLKLHFDAISNQLLKLDSRHPGANQELRRLIAYHSRVIEIADNFNEIMNFSFLGGLFFSTTALCMTSVAILLLDLQSAIKSINGLIAFIVYNFVICFLGTDFTLAHQMQLEDFMRYQDLVCQAAQLPRYWWNGRRSLEVKPNLAKRIIFWIGAVNLLYHNIGCVMFGYFVDGRTEDPLEYLGELASVASMLGFTIVGTLNLWKMLSLKSHFESILDEFEDLFHLTKQISYRTHRYHEEYTRHIRNAVVFHSSAVVYYNSLPIFLMIREHLSNSQQLSYRIQSSTWYPWQTKGSIPGFLAAVVCQIFSCQTNISVNMFMQFMVNFFGIQLEIHFDGLARQLETIDARHPHAKDRLKYLIVYHTKLLNLADRVNRCFNFTFLISLSVSMISTCFLAFSMTIFDFSTSLKHLLGIMLFITYNFLMCRSGTHLILKSGKVLPAAFYNNWYEGDLAYRRMLLILMMRATKPYMWRTYKLAPVSITTYMATLKFSYQMFTCVRSLK